MRNAILLVMCFALLFACGCDSPRKTSSKKKYGKAKVQSSAGPLLDKRTELQNKARIKPDRRVLLAVADIHNFITGDSKEQPSLELDGDKWLISYKGKECGELAEFADFEEITAFLSTWAATVDSKKKFKVEPGGKEYAEITSNLNNFYAPYAFTAAGKAADYWNKGEKNETVLGLGSQALTLIAFQTMDYTDVADDVIARALAAFILTRTFTKLDLKENECMLAEKMGYTAHSYKVAETLPEASPLKFYVLRKKEPLLKLVTTIPADPKAQYLYLKYLGKMYSGTSQQEWNTMGKFLSVEQSMLLPLLETGMSFDAYDTENKTAKAIVTAIQKEILGFPHENDSPKAPGTFSVAYAQLVNAKDAEADIETALAKIKVPQNSFFLDRDLVVSYYRGYFYSCLYRLSLPLLNQDPYAYRTHETQNPYSFISKYLKRNTNPVARQYREWYVHIAGLMSRRAESALQMDAEKFAYFGGPMLQQMFVSYSRIFKKGSPALRKFGNTILCRLDSRPGNLYVIELVASNGLNNLNLVDRAFSKNAEFLPPPDYSFHGWYACYKGDTEQIKKLLESPEVDPVSKMQMLTYLANDKKPDTAYIEKIYRQNILEIRKSSYLLSYYVDYLISMKKYDKAETALVEFLKQPSHKNDFIASTQLADVYFEKGKYKQALQLLKPYETAYQPEIMRCRVLCLNALGKKTEAEAAARDPGKMDPDKVIITELYLRNKDYSKLLFELKLGRSRIDAYTWEKIADRFAEVYRKNTREGTKAAEILISNGCRYTDLLAIARHCSLKGNNELAFNIVRKLKPPNLPNADVMHYAVGYKYLKTMKGQKEAIDWYKKQIPLSRYSFAGLASYYEDIPELLWQVVPLNDPRQEINERNWLARAGVFILGKSKDTNQEKQILDFYKTPTDTFYNVTGRYLMGLASEEDVIKHATNAKQQYEAAHALGMKAQADGRYQDAVDWYLTCIELSTESKGEHAWSLYQILSWAKQSRSLDYLEKHPVKRMTTSEYWEFSDR